LKGRKSNGLVTYLKSFQAWWFWSTFSIAIIYLIIVFWVPPFFPLIVARQILAIILFFWLPGYMLIKLVFPKKRPKQSKENLKPWERSALSVGTSIALVPMIGLLLNYTPSGVTLAPILLSMVLIILSLSFGAILREYRNMNS
jgi:uncharacterized membrane protein